jgi:hypothetical protein
MHRLFSDAATAEIIQTDQNVAQPNADTYLFIYKITIMIT